MTIEKTHSALSLDIRELKKWFHLHKRKLPWRERLSPYAIWISEVMLQQTQVQVVLPYFQRWLIRFPTIKDLASANLEEVMKYWEGLGYYSRARNVHSAAQFLLKHYDGELPSSKEQLQSIKGIGPYTVGAILSFAFRQKAAAVDGNVIRVLTRYFLIEEDISKSKTKKYLHELTESLLSADEPWIIMEALIELGAQVCSIRPKCFQCPIQKNCLGLLNRKVLEIPVKKTTINYEQLFRSVAVIFYGNEILVQKINQGQVMHGLYEFPYLPLDKKNREVEHLKRKWEELFALKLLFYKELKQTKHSFTRFRAHLFPIIWKVDQKKEIPDFSWIEVNNLKNLPFSSGHRKILNQL